MYVAVVACAHVPPMVSVFENKQNPESTLNGFCGSYPFPHLVSAEPFT